MQQGSGLGSQQPFTNPSQNNEYKDEHEDEYEEYDGTILGDGFLSCLVLPSLFHAYICAFD